MKDREPSGSDSPSVPDYSRRDFLRLGIGATAMAVLAGCEKKADLDLSENQLPLPNIQFKDVPLEGYTPAQFVPKMDGIRLREISKASAQFTEALFKEQIAPRLRAAQSPSDFTQASNDFLNGMLKHLFAQDPKIKEVYAQKKALFDKNREALLLFFNNFLVRDGLKIESSVDPTSRAVVINLSKVEKIQLSVVEDPETKTKYQTPIFYLSDELLPQGQLPEKLQSNRGSYNFVTRSISWDPKSFERLVGNGTSMREIRKTLPDFPEASHILDEAGTEPFLNHESTHALTMQRFPIDEKDQSKHPIAMKIKLRTGKSIEVKGSYNRKSLDELAAVGVELASAHDEQTLNAVRLHLPSLLSNEVPEDYQLGHDVLFAVFTGEGEAEVAKALQSNSGEIQAIGNDMYNLAMHLLKRLTTSASSPD